MLIDLSEERQLRREKEDDDEHFISRADLIERDGHELQEVLEAAAGVVRAIALGRPDGTRAALDAIVLKAMVQLTVTQSSVVNLWVNPPTPPPKPRRRKPQPEASA